MAISKFIDSKVIDFESSFHLSTDTSDSTLSPTSFLIFLDFSFHYISFVSRDPISSPSLIIFKSFASLIVVALYENLVDKDLMAFFTSFSYGVFSSRVNNPLAMSHNFPLNSLIVSSSLIRRLFNFSVGIGYAITHRAVM